MRNGVTLGLMLLAFAAAIHANTIKRPLGYIVDGHRAQSKQFPYYAFINIRYQGRGGTACGGTLINVMYCIFSYVIVSQDI